MKQVCIYHIAEQFLYEYYCDPGEYEVLEEDKVSILLGKAAAEEAKGGIMAALQDLEEAEEWNPVNTEVKFRLIDLYYRLGRKEDLYEETKAVYPYCSTRAEIAQYYRWLGYYYLENYKAELAEVLYRVSLCYESSRTAESEIRFLENALGRKVKEYTPQELMQQLGAAGLPLGASEVTLALLYNAGAEAEAEAEAEAGLDAESGADAAAGAGAGTNAGIGTAAAYKNTMRQQALDCYHMVYDLSGDPEVASRIDRIQNRP